MRIEARTSNVPISEALHMHISRKLDFALRRFENRTVRVVLRLVDLNGPKGGPDKRCRVAARLSTGPTVIAEATDADAYVAVTHAAARLHDKIARALGRRRHWSRSETRRPAQAADSSA
jgi:putative sigma-54 modulation protein